MITEKEYREWIVRKFWRSQKQLDSIMKAWGYERIELFNPRSCVEKT